MSTTLIRTVYRGLMRNARAFDRNPSLKLVIQREHRSLFVVYRQLMDQNQKQNRNVQHQANISKISMTASGGQSAVSNSSFASSGSNPSPIESSFALASPIGDTHIIDDTAIRSLLDKVDSTTKLEWRFYDLLLGKNGCLFNPQHPHPPLAKSVREWAKMVILDESQSNQPSQSLNKRLDAALALLRELNHCRTKAAQFGIDTSSTTPVTSSSAHPQSQPMHQCLSTTSALKPGSLLVAHPLMQDPFDVFRYSVVLISDYSPESGAKGLILNRPIPMAGLAVVGTVFADLFRMANPLASPRIYHDSVFFGGPRGQSISCLFPLSLIERSLHSTVAYRSRGGWSLSLPASEAKIDSNEIIAHLPPGARMIGNGLVMIDNVPQRQAVMQQRTNQPLGGELLQVVTSDVASLMQHVHSLSAIPSSSLEMDTRMRFFVGKAEWTTGQLEREYQEGSWVMAEATTSTSNLALPQFDMPSNSPTPVILGEQTVISPEMRDQRAKYIIDTSTMSNDFVVGQWKHMLQGLGGPYEEMTKIE